MWSSEEGIKLRIQLILMVEKNVVVLVPISSPLMILNGFCDRNAL